MTRRGAVLGAAGLVASAAPSHAESRLDESSISAIAESEIAAGRIPGAVIVIGRRDRVLYRAAFGHRVLGDRPVAMTTDTIFDLASLTKPVATATAIMQLIDAGLLELDAPAAHYWRDFGRNGKQAITIRHLLTHYSGLRADLDLSQGWTGAEPAMQMVVGDTPIAPPGERFLYSDIGYLALGAIVERVAVTEFSAYCAERIFAPLQMSDTLFRPADRSRVAPTQDIPGYPHWGDAHDATTRWMGGVSGSAGLFSTADDLALFLRMLLARGVVGRTRVLSSESARRLVAPQTPPRAPRARSLGWDVGGPRGFGLFPRRSFGHLGYTGGMMWAHIPARVWLVALTHRVYPDGRGDADPLRRRLMSAVESLCT
jgi:CubicO group peptidase (beta-lactamase class C family)